MWDYGRISRGNSISRGDRILGDDITTLVYVGDFDNSDDKVVKNYEEDILYTSSYPLGIIDYAKDGTITFEEHTVVSDGEDDTWVEHTCVNDKLNKK